MDTETFTREIELLDGKSSEEKKSFYAAVLKDEVDKSEVRVLAYYQYALLFYEEGNFKQTQKILEPFVFDYQSYPYIPQMISCLNLIGAAAKCEGNLILARYYFKKALAVIVERNAEDRYAYEYNNICLTYMDEKNYPMALKYILQAENLLSKCSEDIGAFVFVNQAEIYLALDRIPEAKTALKKCFAHNGKELLARDIDTMIMMYYFKSGNKDRYRTCREKVMRQLPRMSASEFMDSCRALFQCGMQEEEYSFVSTIIDEMDTYMQKHPDEYAIGLNIEDMKIEYYTSCNQKEKVLQSYMQKDAYNKTILSHSQASQVNAIEQYLSINRHLQKAVQSEAKANKVKEELLANMSHDIRTPINGIMGMLNMITSCREDREKVDDCLEKMKSSSEHLLSLANDVLDIHKLETDSVDMENRPFQLKKVLKEVNDVVLFQAEQAGISVQEEYSPLEEIPLLGSDVHLKQILLNLFTNSIKYNVPHGSIHTRIRKTEETKDSVTIQFFLADTGIGMTQEFIDHYLFEPFMREKSMQRSDQEGTGLGMAIVARLVDKMHGSIHVESTVGKGSTFLLTLPFEKDLSCLQGKQEVIEEDILRDKTVLLVEDNALNMEIAEFLLKSLHATIVKAVNGKEAVDIFRKSSETLDYIFMDLMMPVMDGYEATRAIRSCSLSRAGSIPIFAMSANAYKEDIQKCIRCGMNGHISKPIFRESILRVISEYARSLETDGKEGRSCESIS